MDSSSERKIGTILGYAHVALQSVISILYIPLLINGIGDGEYGLYQIMSSIIAYFAIMESPMSAAILRFYSQYKAKGEIEQMENVLAVGQKIFRYISGILIIVTIPSVFLVLKVYANSFTAWELKESIIMFLIMILNIVITLNNYVYVAVINANEKYVFIKLLSIATLLLQPISVYMLIKKIPYAITIVTVQVVFNLIVSLTRRYYARKRLNIRIKLHNKNMQLVKRMVFFSASILLVALADQIFWRSGQLILGAIFDTSTVAIYSVGAQLNTMYISIACVLGNLMMPVVTQIYHQRNGEEKLTNYFTKIGRLQSFLVCLIISGVVLFGKEFIVLLSGENYLPAYYVALLLMIPYAVDLVQICGGTILQIKDMYKYRAYTLTIMAAINIVLTVIFSKHIGLIGAAIATAICTAIGFGIVMNCIYLKKAKLNIWYFWTNVIPICFGTFLCMISGGLINKIQIEQPYIQFAVHVALYILLYSVFMFVFMFNKNEKEQSIGFVKRIWRK